MFSTPFQRSFYLSMFRFSFFSLISLCDPQRLLMLYPLEVRLTECTKGNTYLFCVDRTGCWYRWKRMSAIEKEKSKESKWEIKRAMKWLFSPRKKAERKMKNKSITRQSFNEIKVSHRKLFNQKLRFWLLSPRQEGKNKSVLTSIVICLKCYCYCSHETLPNMNTLIIILSSFRLSAC